MGRLQQGPRRAARQGDRSPASRQVRAGLGRLEAILGALLVSGIALALLSPFVFQDRDAGRYSTLDRRKAVAQWNRETNPARQQAMQAMWVGGWSLSGAALGAGLLIAFGVGPSWMAVWQRRWYVTERFGYADGHKIFGAEGESLQGRLYVRFRMPNGRTMELSVPKEVYRAASVGMLADVKVLGRTARAIRPSGPRGTP